MRKGLRRTYHKQLMRMIHNANRSLRKDHLFLGRFECSLVRERWYQFPDNSGGIIYADIRCHDKKDHIYKDYRYEYAPYYRSKYWNLNMEILNDFIVKVSSFWDKREVIDFTHDKVDWNRLNKQKLSYFTEEYADES